VARRAARREYSLGFLLADVLRLSRLEFRRQASGLPLTPALSRLLFYVDQRPGCSQAELAGFLDLTSATVGRMIDRLEAGGFVRRQPDANDRRAFRIHLDAAAGPLIGRMHAALDRTAARAMRGIDDDEQAALRATLERMRANLAREAP
jgi:DNA-binding MarR family transcriptional regulator